MPEKFFTRAADIVQAHKPKDAELACFKPEMVLRPEDHRDLNRPMEVAVL